MSPPRKEKGCVYRELQLATPDLLGKALRTSPMPSKGGSLQKLDVLVILLSTHLKENDKRYVKSYTGN